ncbi:hypothetical protein AGRA3207_003727 [Actinomadura graeca]|uniref:Uncharacterized protein n=1 Tax=Actinomadura graeca TaxID=2750812 RepID=A0ABX8QVD1_9ACTN|nr:hypothetical protein [Actinomadura graeca]QXJ22682.1 hypothetical protein AGRA3207_003727 [Actinomadura graeca]
MGEAAVLSRVRARWRHRAVVRRLEPLAVAVAARGLGCVRLYEVSGLPMLWVHGSGDDENVGLVVGVRAAPGGSWAFCEVHRGRAGYLGPCGDVTAAAVNVDGMLERRLFTSG